MLNRVGQEFVEHSGMGEVGQQAGCQRIDEEVQEAAGARSHSELAVELADVVLTCAALAAVWGIDLDAEVLRKHAINLTREWQPHPYIEGAVKRVKGTGVEP